MNNKDFSKKIASTNDNTFNFYDKLYDILSIAYANDASPVIHEMYNFLSWCDQEEIKDFDKYPAKFEEVDPLSYEWDIWLVNHGFEMKLHENEKTVDFVGHGIILHREEEENAIYWAAAYSDDDIKYDLNPIILLLEKYTIEDLDSWKEETIIKFKNARKENRKKCIRR